MDSDEQIQAHILSVWLKEKKLISRGKEIMLILTNKHLMFFPKTDLRMRWWDAATRRQAVALMKSKDVMIKQDGYKEKELRIDLENEKNSKVSFDNIIDISSEEKVWGSVLNLELYENGKKKKYQCAVVLDWVKYPIKDPTKHMKVDWSSFVQYVKDKQRIKR